MNIHQFSILRPILRRIVPKQSLRTAVERNDIDLVFKICRRHGVFDEDAYLGAAPLQKAAFLGRTEIAELLLGLGKNPDVRGADGSTPLHFVTSAVTAQSLLDRGADPNAKDYWWDTPLHLRAEGGDIEVAKQLVASGADVEAENRAKQTPLHYASAGGATLLGTGGFRQRVLLWRNRPEDVFEKNTRDIETARDYLNPSTSDEVSMVELLLERGSDPNKPDERGLTPLHFAADVGSVRKVSALLNSGANPNARTTAHVPNQMGYFWGGIPEDSTPIHFAVVASLEVVELLLNNGADVMSQNAKGNSPLHTACMQLAESHVLPVVEILLSEQADVTARNSEGDTPVHVAHASGFNRVVEAMRSRNFQRLY